MKSFSFKNGNDRAKNAHGSDNMEFIQRMLFLSEYAFFDYNESLIQVIIDYIAILCLFSGVAYGVGRLLRKQK